MDCKMVTLPGTCVSLIAALAAAPLAAQQNLDLTGTPAVAIDEPFSSLGAVRDLGGGVVLATDPIERRVAMIDLGRGTTRVLGRNGEGPGEYRYVGGLAAAPGRDTWLYDPPMSRFTVITPEGKLTRTVPAPQSIMGFRGADAAGNLYFEGNEYDPATGGFSRMVPIVRFAPGTGRADHVGRVPTGGRVVIQRADGPMSVTRRSSPYPRIDTWVPLPDGRVAIVRADTFRIDLVAADGTMRRGHQLPARVTPVSARDRQAFRDAIAGQRMTANRRGGGGGPSMPALQWEDKDFPVTHPPFRHDAVLASPDGEVWIGRSLPVDAPRVIYDIADASGRIIGTATLRRHSTVIGFGAGAVYVARMDPADDLVYLEKHAR